MDTNRVFFYFIIFYGLLDDILQTYFSLFAQQSILFCRPRMNEDCFVFFFFYLFKDSKVVGIRQDFFYYFYSLGV